MTAGERLQARVLADHAEGVGYRTLSERYAPLPFATIRLWVRARRDGKRLPRPSPSTETIARDWFKAAPATPAATSAPTPAETSAVEQDREAWLTQELARAQSQGQAATDAGQRATGVRWAAHAAKLRAELDEVRADKRRAAEARGRDASDVSPEELARRIIRHAAGLVRVLATEEAEELLVALVQAAGFDVQQRVAHRVLEGLAA